MGVEGKNNSNSGNELIERQAVLGTPYYITGNEEKGYRLVFSRWAMTDPMKTVEDVNEYLENNFINLVLTTVMLIIDPEMKTLNKVNYQLDEEKKSDGKEYNEK